MAAPHEFTVTVPALRDRPVLGGGCCAVLLADVIRDELGGYPGVLQVRVDEECAEVGIRYDAGAVRRTELEGYLRTLTDL